jgi:hypothetical protein
LLLTRNRQLVAGNCFNCFSMMARGFSEIKVLIPG